MEESEGLLREKCSCGNYGGNNYVYFCIYMYWCTWCKHDTQREGERAGMFLWIQEILFKSDKCIFLG